MRNRKNINRSAHSRPRLSTISDLITNSENTISSQATVVSKQSIHFTVSQSQDRWGDLENYEDIISEEAESLRISPEQQQRIQSILELARKGKINPGNAFDVPVRVADPQLGEGQNMRFWKFASELLHASMGIYDKRVEHVYLDTNRMFDNLIRVASNSSEIQQPEARENRKKGELMKIDISDLASAQNVSGYEIATANCEERGKLNIKNSVMQFATDPLFSKRLKAFDSDSLKSLFLNVFQTGENLEILFFHDRQPADKKGMQMEIESHSMFASSSQTSLNSEEQSTKVEQVPKVPRFVEEHYKKLNLIAQTNSCFASLATLRKETARLGVPEDGNLLKDLPLDFDDLRRNSYRFQEKPQLINSIIENSQELNLNHAYLNEANTNFSLNFEPHKQQYESSQLHSQGYQKSEVQYFLSSADETNSATTPWEYQFSGLKLLKKRNPGKKKKGGKEDKKEQKERFELQIDFLDGAKANRDEIFSVSKQQKQSKQTKYKQKFLLPLSFDATALAITQRVGISVKETKSTFVFPNFQKTQLNLTHTQINQVEAEPFLEPSQPFLEPSQQMQIQQPLSAFGDRGAQNSMRNIRELKDRVQQKVTEMGEVFLSQIEFGMSPSSLLVVVLHLVNEQKLQIVQESDNQIKVCAYNR